MTFNDVVALAEEGQSEAYINSVVFFEVQRGQMTKEDFIEYLEVTQADVHECLQSYLDDQKDNE